MHKDGILYGLLRQPPGSACHDTSLCAIVRPRRGCRHLHCYADFYYFISLRDLPTAAYQTPKWSQYLRNLQLSYFVCAMLLLGYNYATTMVIYVCMASLCTIRVQQ